MRGYGSNPPGRQALIGLIVLLYKTTAKMHTSVAISFTTVVVRDGSLDPEVSPTICVLRWSCSHIA